MANNVQAYKKKVTQVRGSRGGIKKSAARVVFRDYLGRELVGRGEDRVDLRAATK